MSAKTFEVQCNDIWRFMNGRRSSRKLAVLLAMRLTIDFPDTAHAWYVRMLVNQLTGDTNGAKEATDRAKRCEDYNGAMPGDMLRDTMLDAIRRRRKPYRFGTCAHIIKGLHADDIERMACLEGVKGRYMYLCGDWERALRSHQTADEGLAGHEQWQANNLLPLLKAQCMAGASRKERNEVFGRIVAVCPPNDDTFDPNKAYLQSRRTLRRAVLCYRLGRLGSRLDDLAQWVYWRLVKRV